MKFVEIMMPIYNHRDNLQRFYAFNIDTVEFKDKTDLNYLFSNLPVINEDIYKYKVTHIHKTIDESWNKWYSFPDADYDKIKDIYTEGSLLIYIVLEYRYKKSIGESGIGFRIYDKSTQQTVCISNDTKTIEEGIRKLELGYKIVYCNENEIFNKKVIIIDGMYYLLDHPDKLEGVFWNILTKFDRYIQILVDDLKNTQQQEKAVNNLDETNINKLPSHIRQSYKSYLKQQLLNSERKQKELIFLDLYELWLDKKLSNKLMFNNLCALSNINYIGIEDLH